MNFKHKNNANYINSKSGDFAQRGVRYILLSIYEKKTFISFLLLYNLSYSQEHVVIDSQTKEVIPFVAVKNLKKQVVFYSNERGGFSIENGNDTLQISCLGYKPLVCPINSLKDTINLDPEILKLNEVVLNGVPRKKEVIGLKRKKIKFYTNPNLQIGILIKPSKEFVGKYIDNVSIPIDKKLTYKMKGNKNFKSVFKVNIYSNELGLPKYSMLEKPLDIFVTHNSKNLINIDLSDNLIQFSEDGMFICLEMVGEIDKDGKIKDIKNHRPSFVFTDKPIKEFSSKSYYRVKFDNKWKPMTTEAFHLEEEIYLAIGITLSSYD